MSETQTSRWMRVGTSSEPDGAVAARMAVEAALAGEDASLVILFVAPVYDMQAVASSAYDAAGGAPLAGCSTSGEIAEGLSGSGRIVAIAMGGDGLVARTSIGLFADGPEEAGAAAAQGLIGLESPHRALMLLSEGLAGNHAAVVRGAYGVGGAMVKLVGGCAGDELALSSTWQICGGDVYTGSVIGIAIGSDGPMGVGLGHGWTSSGETMVVTDSDGQRIFKLDDKPALDLYLDHAGVTSDQLEDPEQWADAMHKRPLGLPRPSGIEVRAVLGADLDDRSLICGDVPQGAIITVMKGDTGTVNEGTRQACVEVLADLGGAAPVGVMAFDCAGRRSVLGEDGVITEMATMAQFFNDVPIGGFYTYGEVARKAGSRGVHNATLVLFALG